VFDVGAVADVLCRDEDVTHPCEIELDAPVAAV
jgi:hypothetical protein